MEIEFFENNDGYELFNKTKGYGYTVYDIAGNVICEKDHFITKEDAIKSANFWYPNATVIK